MKILVTGIGGPTPRSIASVLRRDYPDASIVGVDCDPRALGFYMPGLLDERYVVPRTTDAEAYFRAIHKILGREKIDLALVQPESEVLAWGDYFERHKSYPCPVVMPPLSHAKALVDKARMADLLDGTTYIPKTLRITASEPRKTEVEELIGYPCWIRAATGSGGAGSLKLNCEMDLDAWLLVYPDIAEFTVSEFLPGKHLANQMLYLEGELQLNAGLECVEYVMADIAPSRVTGNTSFGRLIYDERLLSFCEEVIDFIVEKLSAPAHGVYSFDLKLDSSGTPKVTEINVRHMAYTGILAKCGADFVNATVDYLRSGVVRDEPVRHRYASDFVFLRDVDIEPLVLSETDLSSEIVHA